MKAVNPARRARERERAYGPLKRRQWVSSLPCSVPGCTNKPIHNAHVKPEGRPADGPSGGTCKEDYTQVIPLCAYHHTGGDESIHHLTQRPFNDLHKIDVDFVAIYIQDLWLKEGAL